MEAAVTGQLMMGGDRRTGRQVPTAKKKDEGRRGVRTGERTRWFGNESLLLESQCACGRISQSFPKVDPKTETGQGEKY